MSIVLPLKKLPLITVWDCPYPCIASTCGPQFPCRSPVKILPGPMTTPYAPVCMPSEQPPGPKVLLVTTTPAGTEPGPPPHEIHKRPSQLATLLNAPKVLLSMRMLLLLKLTVEIVS